MAMKIWSYSPGFNSIDFKKLLTLVGVSIEKYGLSISIFTILMRTKEKFLIKLFSARQFNTLNKYCI
jgi:hypothetical protein